MTTQTLLFDRPNFMRAVLLANIAFCVTCAIIFTFFSGAVVQFTGAAWGPYYIALGVSLFAFGGFVAYTRHTLHRRLIWIVFALDTAWVVGSFALLGFNLLPITSGAKWAFALIADAVLVFAVLEWWGLRR